MRKRELIPKLLVTLAAPGVIVIAALTLRGPVGAAAPAPQPPVQPNHPELGPIVRELIQRQMSQHAMAAADTWWSAIDLRFESARASSQRLVETTVLAASSEPGTVNSELPPRFFELQEQMRSAARNVQAAATSRDARALAATTGKLTETCVACHAEFRPVPP